MATIVPTDSSSAPTQEKQRLWTGNLPPTTTEDELIDLLKDLNVSEVSIPRKNDKFQSRYPIYAFVTVPEGKSAEEMKDKMSQMVVGENAIKVEVATSDGPFPSVGFVPEHKRTRVRGRGRGRGRNGRGGGRGGGADHSAPADDAGDDGETRDLPTKRSGESEDEGDGNTAPTSSSTKRPAERRRQRQPREDGIPSTTTVYVRNLPFSYKDEDLKRAFEAHNPVGARVLLQRLNPRFREKLESEGKVVTERGLGIGFVTFASEQEQKAAIEGTNKTEVDGRVITVGIAYDRPENATNTATNNEEAGESANAPQE